MALSFQYYQQNVGDNQLDNTSPVYKSHNFTLKLFEDSLIEQEKNFSINSISGIVDELPQISYNTTWGNSPVATLSDKIKKITENKYVKMFATTGGEYRPPIFIDGWTQQVPQTASPLSVSFKFYAYPAYNDGKYYNTSPYGDIIKFLIFATTPQDFVLADTVTYIKTGANNAMAKGEVVGQHTNDAYDALRKPNIDLGKISKKLISDSNDSLSKDDQEAYEALKTLLTDIDNFGKMTPNNAGGCPLLSLKLGNLLRDNDTIHWFIKDWSFKPALNVTFQNNLYEPIYVEFNISLETQQVLTNDEIRLLLKDV